MDDGSSTALTRVTGGSEIARLDDLIQQAHEFAVNARAERTQKEYARCWRQFQDWCDHNRQEAMPATVRTLVAYISELANKGGPKGKPLSESSINQVMAALRLAHATRGAPTEQFASPALREVFRGIKRKIAGERTIRRVKPLLESQLSDLLEMLRPNVMREARDAAILALGFGAARRRSELVGLDYAHKGDPNDRTCRGVLLVEERGLLIKLMVSKTNQEGAEEEYLVPRATGRVLCDVVENWIKIGGIEPGTPLFRKVTGGGVGYAGSPQSGYPGVSWREDRAGKGRWQAVVKVDGRLKHLGYYDDEHTAYTAICERTGATPRKKYAESVKPGRTCGNTIARMIKARIGDLLRRQTGSKRVKPDEIARVIADYSGHSLRAGLVTSAAERGVALHDIKAVSGHKGDAMVGRYIRSSNMAKNPTLKGSGFS